MALTAWFSRSVVPTATNELDEAGIEYEVKDVEDVEMGHEAPSGEAIVFPDMEAVEAALEVTTLSISDDEGEIITLAEA